METLDLGNETVQFIGWKAQKETWSVDGTDCDIKKILIDPKSVKIGQGKLAQGVAPIWEWQQPGTEVKVKEGFKKAFFITVYLSEKYGAPETGWRDWMTNQAASKKAIMAVWNDIGPEYKNNQDKVAIVEITGSESQSIGENKINVPILKMKGWTDKPKHNKPEPKPEPVMELQDDLEF